MEAMQALVGGAFSPGAAVLLLAGGAVLLVCEVLIVIVVLLYARRAGPLRQPVQRLEELARRLLRFEEALTVPRQRGALGERLLEDLLATWLPRSGYATQVTLPGGARVDAVVRLGARGVPIDAKFPFEAVEEGAVHAPLSKAAARAVGRHVAAVADKYVLPDAGTYNFALLYVPSDALYLRCFADAQGALLSAALRRRVVPVGPSALYLYLHTVGHAVRGLRLAAAGLELADTLQRARDEVTDLAATGERMASQLLQLGRSHDETRAQVRSLDSALTRLSGTADRSASPDR